MTQRHLPRLPRLRAPHYLAYSSPLRPRWILEKYQRHTNHHRRNIQNITIAPHWRESQQINNTQGEGVEPLEPGWHMDFIIVHFNFLLLRFNSLSQQTTQRLRSWAPRTWLAPGLRGAVSNGLDLRLLILSLSLSWWSWQSWWSWWS